MEIRCAWCDSENGIKPPTLQKVSHGICLKHKEEIEKQLNEFDKNK